MNSTNKKLLILVALQAVLIVGMRFAGFGHPESLSQPVTLIPGFDPDKVTEIEIMGQPKLEETDPVQESVVLKKSGATWVLATSADYPVETSKVTEALNAIKDYKSRSKVLEGKDYHAKLQVSENNYQRKVTVHSGASHVTLYLGTSPSFKRTHVRVDGNDAVYLVNGANTSDLGTRAWNWVNRALVEVPEKDLWAVEIQNKKGKILLEKSPENNQFSAVGLKGDIDTSEINDLVRKARSVNLEEPVGKEIKPEFGLNPPLATVRLTKALATTASPTETAEKTKPEKTEVLEYIVGNKIESESRYYAKVGNSDYIVKLASWAIDPLVTKTAQDLIKKQETPKK